MPLNSFDKELISTNLLGATNLKELHRKEKLLTNTKMLSLQENHIFSPFAFCYNIHNNTWC
jgi:hypothetical protein